MNKLMDKILKQILKNQKVLITEIIQREHYPRARVAWEDTCNLLKKIEKEEN